MSARIDNIQSQLQAFEELTQAKQKRQVSIMDQMKSIEGMLN